MTPSDLQKQYSNNNIVTQESLRRIADFSQGYFDDFFKSESESWVEKKPKGNAPGSIYTKVKGIVEPDEKYIRLNIDNRGIRERFYQITFSILREIAKKVAPIASIHTLRSMQVRPFSVKSYNEDDTGFIVKLKDKKRIPTKKEKIQMEEIENFLLHSGKTNFTGWTEREEGMEEINELLVREFLTIDQVAISLRKNRKGELLDYWVLDGATIKRTLRGKGFEGDKEITFVQEIDGIIAETFTSDDIIFYYANRRADIRTRGYGYSFIEMCVDVITSWIFGMSYNKEFFNSSSQPKGILTFEGDKIDQSQIEELQRQWIAMFRGLKGLWRTPFLQYNAKWQNIAPSNRDMEFNEYIQVLSSWVFAIHGTDAQEVGMRLNQAQNVLNDNQEAKINFSKSRALRHLLRSLEVVYNKIMMRVPEWDEYYMMFTGFEKKDQAEETDVAEKRVSTYATVDEERAAKDLPPLPNGEGQIILNAAFLQTRQLKSQEQQMQSQQSSQGNENQETNNSNGKNNNWEVTKDDLIPEHNDEEKVNKSKDDDYIEIIL